MIYHPKEHKIVKIVKFLSFWISLFVMAWFFILIFYDDVKVPQQKIVINIDIHNKANICLPEQGEDLQESESFFGF